MRIDPEFKALIAPLQPEELTQLEANLMANGCRDPLVLWKDILVDGHNRYEICHRRGIKFRTVEIALPSREHVLLWIEENQLGRRNLSTDQRSEITESIAERRSELAKKERASKGRAAGGKATPEQVAQRQERLPDTASGKRSHDRSKESLPATAKAFRVPERKLRAIREIKKKLKSTPKVLAKTLADIRAGEKTIQKVKRELRAAEREERVEQARRIATVPDPSRCLLLHGDLARVQLDEDCADVIITDPPYPKEFLPVFSKLAALAVRCLKPGGSLLVMSGQTYLPEVLQALDTEGLDYRWTIAYLTPGGQSVQIFPCKVNTFWKPVLWYVKGKYSGDWVGDVVKSATNDNDKRFHGWGQSESGMATLVERFSLPGQTILDPFLGGGTTAVVALKMGRRFIGIDCDEAAIQITRARLPA